ncbi:ATP synthase F0 subcomplex B subunit [Salinihabitans flavidus]|uniref:ATP synthase subunit b n=1 Tax=Salinihabitans flavidus TaxID=569882 RepID=A0A1H8VY99_9RHOB|nr:F0F1 ATP synthase subunit delta [Salinihabitans flavidus]SEP20369.1 ATP synthase F0 subcomplex B subunit [Salinihabitans flavidus]
MQIDWLTVAAQIVNFLVLIWLLQRFLYRPITNAMARREARIEERLSDAKARRREAEDEAEDLRKEREELESSRQEMLEEARAEADELRQRLEQDIRDEVEQKRENWQDMLLEERADFARDMQRKAGHKVLDIAARLLAEFTSGALDDQIAQGFVARLKELDKDTRKKMTAAARDADGPALVETATALDTSARRKITRAIHEQFETGIEVEYQEDEEVLLGVRLAVDEQTVEWSAARHLNRLNRELDALLDSASPVRRKETTD